MRLMEAVEIYRYLMNLALAGRLKIFRIFQNPHQSPSNLHPISIPIKLHTFNGRRSTRRPSKGSAPPEAAGHEEVGIAMAWALEDRSGRSGKMLTSDLKIHHMLHHFASFLLEHSLIGLSDQTTGKAAKMSTQILANHENIVEICRIIVE